MLQTDDSWEKVSNIQVLRSIMGKPGLRQYPLVNLSMNVYLFHVDVLFKGEGAELDLWERFICYDLATTVEIIEQEEVADIIVNLQTKFSRQDSYQFYRVVEIQCFSKVERTCTYSCICENGFYFEDQSILGAGVTADSARTVFRRT